MFRVTPGIEMPREHGMLDVGDGQHLWWEEWGDPAGLPAVYLHGGPGGGLGSSMYRQRFDLDRTRVVGLEQRGCGRSTPHASDPSVSLTQNTTAALVGDLERLREHLGIAAWLVNGVSWGSTLALAYAQAHRERVLGLVLVAVTTTSRREVDWITEGIGCVFPEAWDRFAHHAEQAGIGYRRGHGRLVQAYGKLLDSTDPAVRQAAAVQWALWEDTHASVAAGGVHRDPRWQNIWFRDAFLRLTAHYWSHDGFCDPPLLEQIARLADIPAVLIHGRRDISSPAVTAWQLHQQWPASELVIEERDGHGGTSIAEHWTAANNRLVTDLAPPRS